MAPSTFARTTGWPLTFTVSTLPGATSPMRATLTYAAMCLSSSHRICSLLQSICAVRFCRRPARLMCVLSLYALLLGIDSPGLKEDADVLGHEHGLAFP